MRNTNTLKTRGPLLYRTYGPREGRGRWAAAPEDKWILAVGAVSALALALIFVGGIWADTAVFIGGAVTLVVAVPLTAWGVWLLLTGTAKDLADLARTLWADIRPALMAKGKAAR